MYTYLDPPSVSRSPPPVLVWGSLLGRMSRAMLDILFVGGGYILGACFRGIFLVAILCSLLGGLIHRESEGMENNENKC